jgi:hypothetical protein
MALMQFNGFIAFLTLSALISGPLIAAIPEDYIGNWHVTAYGDNDFSDGVTLRTYNLSVNFAQSSDPVSDLNFSAYDTNLGGTLNTSLNVDSSGAARIPYNDVSWPGTWPEFPTNLGDAVFLTEGNGMAMGVVGREPTDRDRTGFFYSLWQKSPISTVTRDDFLGAWETTQRLSDPNLRNSGSLSTNYLPAFTITAGSSSDTIIVELDREGIIPIELQVTGNRAFLNNMPLDVGDGFLLAFDLLHDGNNILLANVGQEYDDLTDISLGVGISSPVPLPATIWFLMSGIGLFGMLGHRARSKGGAK